MKEHEEGAGSWRYMTFGEALQALRQLTKTWLMRLGLIEEKRCGPEA